MLERVWCILLRQGEVPFRYEDVWTLKFSKRGLSQIQLFEYVLQNQSDFAL